MNGLFSVFSKVSTGIQTIPFSWQKGEQIKKMNNHLRNVNNHSQNFEERISCMWTNWFEQMKTVSVKGLRFDPWIRNNLSIASTKKCCLWRKCIDPCVFSSVVELESTVLPCYVQEEPEIIFRISRLLCVIMINIWMGTRKMGAISLISRMDMMSAETSMMILSELLIGGGEMYGCKRI